VIDIHCHLLPGIDDGPPTLEAALALGHALAADGIEHVVCTPHVYPGRFDNRRTSIADEFEAFASKLAQTGCPLTLSWAGEVRLTPEVLDLLARDELPFLGLWQDARSMLLEMPDGQIPLGAERFVQRLMAQRIRPVLVHPERNRAVMERPERLQRFVDMGCYVQLTAGSITGHFGAKAQETAVALLEEEWVHAVASDAHNLGGRRPRMSEAAAWLTKRYGEEHARQLTQVGPTAIIHMNGVVNTRSGEVRNGSVARSAPPIQ
jgi:protein-tyrosine phosphatase